MEVKKNERKILIVFCILFSILTFLAFFYAFGQNINILENPISEENTVEFTATIEQVIFQNSADAFYEIHTVEYGDKLFVNNNKAIIDKSILINLSQGQIITFRVQKRLERFLVDDSGDGVSMVALKTQTKEIMTLESYNIFLEAKHASDRLIGIILGSVFLFLTIPCFLGYMGMSRGRM